MTQAFAIAALLLWGAPALAVPIVAMQWRTGTGSSARIEVSGTLEQEIVADVVLMLDAGDDSRGIFLSVLWDDDGQDELDLVGFRESPSVTGIGWAPVVPGPGGGSAVPSVESLPGVAGVQGGFESAPPFGSMASVSGPLAVTLGSVAFRTNPANIASDGADVQMSALANGVDGFIFGNFVACDASTPCNVAFLGAAVDLAATPAGLVPEPASGLLLLVGGVLMARGFSRGGRSG
jgi:hypothetical protein